MDDSGTRQGGQALPVVPGDDGRVIDPVCGMSVDLEAARVQGLSYVHDGTEYGFCGRGCRLDFEEDPARFLASGYAPSM